MSVPWDVTWSEKAFKDLNGLNNRLIDRVADAFKIKRVARVLEDRQEIWDAPLLFATILLALFLEWILRKKFRMV